MSQIPVSDGSWMCNILSKFWFSKSRCVESVTCNLTQLKKSSKDASDHHCDNVHRDEDKYPANACMMFAMQIQDCCDDVKINPKV